MSLNLGHKAAACGGEFRIENRVVSKCANPALFCFLPILEFGAVVLFRGFAACVNNRRSEYGLRRPFASNGVLLTLLLLRCCDDAGVQLEGRNILGPDAGCSRHEAAVYRLHKRHDHPFRFGLKHHKNMLQWERIL